MCEHPLGELCIVCLGEWHTRASGVASCADWSWTIWIRADPVSVFELDDAELYRVENEAP